MCTQPRLLKQLEDMNVEDTILKLEGIRKEHPGVIALDRVNVEFKEGEVHALLGENGAGKSTLIKILSGAIEPNVGTIKVGKKIYQKMTPALSQSLGIGVIYQEFNLVPSLTVTENIFLGCEKRHGIIRDTKGMYTRAKELIDMLGVDIDPNIEVRHLSVAYQQIVEIVKALSKNVKILIMDEPSAPLTNTEVEALFKLVYRLKEKGVTIIYISHRMEEIFEICDRVTVIRDGLVIETAPLANTNKQELISWMVGRELNEQYPKSNAKIGDVVFEAKDICAYNYLKNINLKVRAGEIVGIAGLVGAGRTEFARAVFGASPIQSGKLYMNGKEVCISSPQDAIREGIALLPEDRKQQGLLLHMNIEENISFVTIKDISRGTVINKRKEKQIAKDYSHKLRIKTPSIKQLVKNLSGGNQQKVALAKWMVTKAKLMIFDEPTRGIDVGAKQEIYQLINELAENGMAIIMISSEMPELLGVSNQIVVMGEGEIKGMLSTAEATQQKILSVASSQKEGV